MKKFKLFFLLTVGIALFTACNDANEECPTNPLEGNKEVKANFYGSIDELKTRASGTKWGANDAIGIYALNNGSALADAAIYDSKANIQYKTSVNGTVGKFDPVNAAEAISFPGNGDKLDFVAYYPYAATITTDYKCEIDLSNQSALPVIDFLYAQKASVDKTATKVDLVFKHTLSRVVIILKTNETSLNLDGATVKIKNIIADGKLKLVDGMVEAGSTKADVTLNYDDTNDTATGILMPGQDMATVTFMITLADGTEYEFTPDAATLKQNTSNKYTLTLTSGSVVAKIEGTIEDWGAGTEVTKEVDPKTTKPAVSVDKSSISFTAAAGTSDIQITTGVATQTWTVTSDATWLTVSSASGTATATVTLSATANTATAQRTATVTITPASGDAVKVAVTQAAGTSAPTVGDGTKANPYTVEQAIAKQGASGVWVRAFIVGYTINGGFVLNTTNASGTNIAVAGSDSETDETKILAVQLPSGAVRNDLNLSANPGKLHVEVLLKGNLTAYYAKPGLKSVSEYEIK